MEITNDTGNGNAARKQCIDNEDEQCGAVQAAKRLVNVVAVASPIPANLPDPLECLDGQIAFTAATRLESCATVPQHTVGLSVHNAQVLLKGTVEWQYQKRDAESAVKQVPGVRDVINQIEVKPKSVADNIKKLISSEFERDAILDALKIQVTTSGGKITLSGTVRTFAERDEAERSAWSCPGVTAVENLLIVTR